MEKNNLGKFHLDVFKELGNIGSGNALISLSKLINRRVEMHVPTINILEYGEVAELMGGAEVPVVGILLDFTGDIRGCIMFVLEPQYAYSLIGVLRNKNVQDITELGEIDVSALKEVGNILAGAYLSALTKISKLDILPSVPYFAYDMAGAILSVPAIQFGQMSDNILYIETFFAEGTNNIMGKCFLIPDWVSSDILLKALGVKQDEWNH